MRSLLSTLLALGLLAGLFWVGGAAAEPRGGTVDISPARQAPPVPFALPFTPGEGTSPPPAPPEVPAVVPDPVVGEARNAWFGCQPPAEASVCVSLTTSGPEDLVPSEPAGVEDWRPLVEAFFAPDDVERALRVMQCESHGNPVAKNPRSTASGLFQHLASMWPPRAEAAGFGGSDVFDPVANVATAAWLVYEGGGWSHWNPSRRCWNR